MHYYKYCLGTIAIPTHKSRSTRKVVSSILSSLFLITFLAQPLFSINEIKVQAEGPEGPLNVPKLGVDKLQNPEYYPLAEVTPTATTTTTDTTVQEEQSSTQEEPVPDQGEVTEEGQTEEETTVQPESITEGTEERLPAKTEVLDENYYGFSVTVENHSDFEEITFKVKHESGEYSPEYILQPADTMFGESNTDLNTVLTSELYTFVDGITEIQFFFEGEKIINVRTYAFSDSAVKEDPDSIKPDGVIPDEFASTTAEVAYKELLFNKLGFNLVTREEWGAPTSSPWAPTIADINRIVVHHTATGVDMSNPKNTVKAIYNNHYFRCADNSGSYNVNDPTCNEISEIWGDIGYNYLIDPYGNVYEGRSGGNGVVGAHAVPNTGSIGISILGDYSSQLPTQAALTSLSKLMSVLGQLNSVDLAKGSTVFGHRDINATACPGAVLYGKLNDIVNLANQYLGQNSLLFSINQKRDDLINSRKYHEINNQVELILDISKLSTVLKEKMLTKSRGITSVRQVGNTLFYTVPLTITDQIITETLLISEDTNIQPNFLYSLKSWDNSDPDRSVPSDFNSTTHWTHEKTNVPEAWKAMGGCTVDNSCGGDQSVVVAVIDTGIAYENYNYDAGSSYSTEEFSGLYVEVPSGAANGVYNEGYDREYTVAGEFNGVTVVNPKDTAQQFLCALRDADPDPDMHCNATELAKINHANDDYGHGTFVATIIAGDTSDAATNKVVGISHNISIMPIKAMLPNDKTMCQDANGNLDLTCSNPYYDYRAVGTSYTIAEAIDHARTNGAEVINMSLGGYGTDTMIQDAVTDAVNAGITVVVSAGNEDDNVAYYYPASYSNVIAVGSTNSDDTRSSYSNYGTQLDIVAPVGQSGQAKIASQSYTCFGYACSDETNPNLFKSFTSSTTPSTGAGTSYASPQAAAAVALAKSLNPALTPDDMYNLLAGTATVLGGGFNQYTGYGMLDIEGVVTHVNDIPDLPSSDPAYSANPDTYTDIIAYNIYTRQVDVTPSTGSDFGGGSWGFEVWNSNTTYDAANWSLLKPADVNGDGLIDLIAFNRYTTEVDVTLSSGSDFGGGNQGYQIWNYYTAYSSSQWKLLDPADANGDGRADLIAYNLNTKQINVTLSTGSSFGGGYLGSQVWNSNSGYSMVNWALFHPADVNGDGRADIIAIHKTTRQIDVTLSTGTNFGGGQAGFQVWNSDSGYTLSKWFLFTLADVNDDERADIIALNKNTRAIYVTLSTGTNFGGGQAGFQVWNTDSGYTYGKWRLLSPNDVNGDGRADIIAFNINNTMIDVTLSTGTNFGGGAGGFQVWNVESAYTANKWVLLD